MKRPVTGAVVGNQSSEPSTTEAAHSRITSVLQAVMLEGQPTKALETKHGAAGFGVYHAGFCLALVQYFLTVPTSPFFFGMRMDILCHCMVEACNWFFDFQGDVRDCIES